MHYFGFQMSGNLGKFDKNVNFNRIFIGNSSFTFSSRPSIKSYFWPYVVKNLGTSVKCLLLIQNMLQNMYFISFFIREFFL